jgi:hypothetical protein
VGRAPEADPSIEAVVVPRETAGAAAASSPPDVLPALAPASAEAVAVLAVEPPVAADAEMAEASLFDASEEGGTEPRPVLGSGNLVPTRCSPDWRRQSLRFWTRGASDPLFVLDDEREEQSWDGLRECAEATVGSLRSTLEVLCRDVPKILQVRISGIPFMWSRRSLWRLASFPQDLTDLSAAKSSFIRRKADVWGSLRFLRTTLDEATERLSQWSAEVADLRLLCVDLGAEAAAARAEAQRQQLELGQVIGERDQSRGRAAEAESRAEALGDQLAEASARAGALAADLAVAQAASSEQRARAEGMSWLF